MKQINPTAMDEKDEVIRELLKELNRIRKNNLRIRMHMQVLVSHPLGIASMKISRQYTSQLFTKNLQLCRLN